jgi:hypothetical protein
MKQNCQDFVENMIQEPPNGREIVKITWHRDKAWQGHLDQKAKDLATHIRQAQAEQAIHEAGIPSPDPILPDSKISELQGGNFRWLRSLPLIRKLYVGS